MAEQDDAAGQSPLDSVPVRPVTFCLGWVEFSEFQTPLDAEACEVRLGIRRGASGFTKGCGFSRAIDLQYDTCVRDLQWF
jgi:hypothetical protein